MKMLALCTVLGSLACRGGPQNKGSGDFDQVLAEAQPMFAKLAAVRDAVPPVKDLRPVPCPPAEFRSEDGKPVPILRLSWNTLVRVSGGDESLRDQVAPDFTGFSSFSRVADLDGPRREAYTNPNAWLLQEAREEFERSRFVAVLRPTAVQYGSFLGANFKPGFAEGWVVLVRLADASVVCQAPVRAENTGSVSFAQSGSGRSSAQGYVQAGEAAIKEDLRKQTVAAVDRTIATMTGAQP